MSEILTPFLDDYDVLVYAGDCLEVMAQLPEASIDAIVTDPPYELGFMGKSWDSTGIAYQPETWAAMLRILKPGGHLLAFSATRTYHRMTVAIEDAGFEIRDCIAWMYGSGFPKSLDVSKAIDKAAACERDRVPYIGGIASGSSNYGGGGVIHVGSKVNDKPITHEAEKWNGWGTALKPAFEPIVVARKPLIGTVAANVLEHGTGALNIDACRIGSEAVGWGGGGSKLYEGGLSTEGGEPRPALGRWPANIALDETAAAMLDEQSGEGVSKRAPRGSGKSETATYGVWGLADDDTRGHNDTGGASRFFYTAKASRQDRNAGGLADNTHPTVKPTELMRWLIRLVTPPGGIILDPFGGSGSTGLAARAENTRCILIEREDEYLNIIRDRLAQLNLFTEEHM
jgi:site-specific DNA-methyltransferase (adenine-specific)